MFLLRITEALVIGQEHHPYPNEKLHSESIEKDLKSTTPLNLKIKPENEESKSSSSGEPSNDSTTPTLEASSTSSPNTAAIGSLLSPETHESENATSGNVHNEKPKAIEEGLLYNLLMSVESGTTPPRSALQALTPPPLHLQTSTSVSVGGRNLTVFERPQKIRRRTVNSNPHPPDYQMVEMSKLLDEPVEPLRYSHTTASSSFNSSVNCEGGSTNNSGSRTRRKRSQVNNRPECSNTLPNMFINNPVLALTAITNSASIMEMKTIRVAGPHVTMVRQMTGIRALINRRLRASTRVATGQRVPTLCFRNLIMNAREPSYPIVQLAKKLANPVQARVTEFLKYTAEFVAVSLPITKFILGIYAAQDPANAISITLNSNHWITSLCESWHRLLALSMAEHTLEFVVVDTKLSSIQTMIANAEVDRVGYPWLFLPHQKKKRNGEVEDPNLPNREFADGLTQFLDKFRQLNLTMQEFILLRHMVLLASHNPSDIPMFGIQVLQKLRTVTPNENGMVAMTFSAMPMELSPLAPLDEDKVELLQSALEFLSTICPNHMAYLFCMHLNRDSILTQEFLFKMHEKHLAAEEHLAGQQLVNKANEAQGPPPPNPPEGTDRDSSNPNAGTSNQNDDDSSVLGRTG